MGEGADARRGALEDKSACWARIQWDAESGISFLVVENVRPAYYIALGGTSWKSSAIEWTMSAWTCKIFFIYP